MDIVEDSSLRNRNDKEKKNNNKKRHCFHNGVLNIT